MAAYWLQYKAQRFQYDVYANIREGMLTASTSHTSLDQEWEVGRIHPVDAIPLVWPNRS